MGFDLTSTFDRFRRLVDWFIPAGIASDMNMRKQARLFLVSHLCGPFIGNTVPAAILVFDPHPGYGTGVLATSITGFWIFPFLLKRFGRYNLLAVLSIQNLMFCIIWSCLMLGGIQSPTLPWVLTIPLLSFFYLGSSPEIRFLVLGMFAANFVGFWGVNALGVFSPSAIPFAALQALGLVSTGAAALYVTMMALFYAKALDSQRELETEIREHVAAATVLGRAAQDAERTRAAKSEVLARIGTEMRLPLHGVIGYSELLLDEAKPADVATLEVIRDTGVHLLRLVNDVTDLGKIEAGTIEMFVDRFRPTDLIGALVDEMRGAAAARNNTLALTMVADSGEFWSDARKLRIIVFQLLSNAIRFTEHGAIEVRVDVVEDAAERLLVIEVRDTGPGVHDDALPTLFERFAVHDAVSAISGGSGLGLALGRKLSRLLGGDIVLEPRLPRGSCFRVTIPSAAEVDASRLPEGADAETTPLPVKPVRPRPSAGPRYAKVA